jgi:hypothetical protein
MKRVQSKPGALPKHAHENIVSDNKKTKAIIPAPAIDQSRLAAIADKLERSLHAPKFATDPAGKVVSVQKDPMTAAVANVEAYGTANPGITTMIHNQLAGLPKELTENFLNAAIGFMHENRPENTIEAMLLLRIFKSNYLANAFENRALKLDDYDLIDRNVNRSFRLSRTMLAALEALQRYRGKADQTMKVEHVTVESGGQAIIGPIRGGSNGKD